MRLDSRCDVTRFLTDAMRSIGNESGYTDPRNSKTAILTDATTVGLQSVA